MRTIMFGHKGKSCLTGGNRKRTESTGSRWAGVCVAVRLVSFVLMLGCVSAVPLQAQDTMADSMTESIMADPNDGPSYPVREFVIEYQPPDHPGHPPVEVLLNLKIELVQAADGFIGVRDGLKGQSITLSEVPSLTEHRFYASALQAISQRLVHYFTDQGYIGIYVTPHEDDIDPETLEDLRYGDEAQVLRMVVWTGVVTELRTVASGERIPMETRINNPVHARIRANSPVRPAVEGEKERHDLLRKDLLDEYIYMLNRHPGRRVETALSSAELPGEVVLDLMVTENRPWLVYMQASNTGTEETDKWRERFGFTNNQLTGNDDIFAIDYITAGFDSAHSVIGTYEAPFFNVEGARWRILGSWGQYDASEVGFANEEFHSEEWSWGGEISKNIYQKQELFVDAFVGARWRNIQVEGKDVTGVTISDGESDFFLPTVGLRLEKLTAISSTYGQIEYETNLSDVADTDEVGVESLGRLDVDKDWSVMHFVFNHSFYLEPVLNRRAWKDLSSPASSTLAHELVFSGRGQYSFGDRLIAQSVGVVGGLYSVRGYPESVINGDSTLIGSAEYRYHIPKGFNVQPKPSRLFGRPFRWAPQQVYGQPDWDLILRAFFDYGKTTVEDKQSYEVEDDLMGAGVGIELLLSGRFSLRCDWGMALSDFVNSDGENEVDSGDSEFHFIGTLVF
ncbi:MAG: ShlB/FhaC/HecB family hemolysin secretion/activation protein [Sedimentisphaerales bacterium]|nr:ShlB/FhaC/HecB family hemolysin secretion/activation protein [Sedimentisphaerales bacterium]